MKGMYMELIWPTETTKYGENIKRKHMYKHKKQNNLLLAGKYEHSHNNWFISVNVILLFHNEIMNFFWKNKSGSTF
jgi:hypothetical protein